MKEVQDYLEALKTAIPGFGYEIKENNRVDFSYPLNEEEMKVGHVSNAPDAKELLEALKAHLDPVADIFAAQAQKAEKKGKK